MTAYNCNLVLSWKLVCSSGCYAGRWRRGDGEGQLRRGRNPIVHQQGCQRGVQDWLHPSGCWAVQGQRFHERHWSQRSVWFFMNGIEVRGQFAFFMNDIEVRGMFAFLLKTLKSEVNCSFVNHIEVRGQLLFCKWQWSQRPVAFSWMTLKSDVSLLCSSPCPYSIVWHPW